jgi:uncharacterized protein YybS (DUF2232 family)
MKNIIKTLSGIIFIIIFGFIVSYGLNYLNPKTTVLDELEEKIEEVKQKEIILTEPEKQLEKQATEKEWQEVDNQTDK